MEKSRICTNDAGISDFGPEKESRVVHVKKIVFHPDRYPVRDRYPFNLEIFRQTDSIDLEYPVTIFVGENGTGKSTLLEAMARRCGVHIWRNPMVQRVEGNPYEAAFWRYLTVEWVDGRVPGSFFGSSGFQDFARSLEKWAVSDPRQLDYFGGRSLLTQSHGQSILSYFRSRYQRKGIYFLDEPETALSPKSQLAFLEILTAAGTTGTAQFIIATHSPMILACPGAKIYSFDDVPICARSYEETDHFRIYKEFLTGGEPKADPTY